MIRDPEFAALQKCLRALAPLKPERRVAVADYLAVRVREELSADAQPKA